MEQPCFASDEAFRELYSSDLATLVTTSCLSFLSCCDEDVDEMSVARRVLRSRRRDDPTSFVYISAAKPF